MKSNDKFQNTESTDFSGGINNSVPVTDIANNECNDILNLYFDDQTNLITRPGVIKLNSTPSTFPNRITSIYPCYFGSVSSPTVILTSGSNIYREDDINTYTSILGSNMVPNDVFWCFKQFDDLVIGCNGALTGSGYLNPIAWDGEGNIRQLVQDEDNTPAQGATLCEVWNNRLFLVSSDEPNTIYFSALGDPEDFTSNGIFGGGAFNIDIGDGDKITGIYGTKSFLFLFKRKRIYRVVTGEPNTNPNLWQVKKFTENTGCISHFTIQAILDDLVFLSENGLVSLQAVETTESFQSLVLSRKVSQINSYIKSNNDFNKFASVINQSNSEYWLALPYTQSTPENNVVWVLDYKELPQQKLKWVRFDGLIIGCSYSGFSRDGKFQIYIGGNDGNLYKYVIPKQNERKITNDNGNVINRFLSTKAFDFGTKLNRKEIESFGFNLFNNTKFSTELNIDFTIRFDVTPNSQNVREITYNFTFEETLSGSVWDETTPSIGTWASITNSNFDVIRKVYSDEGRKFLSIQFVLENSTLDEDFTIRNIGLNLTEITSRRVNRG